MNSCYKGCAPQSKISGVFLYGMWVWMPRASGPASRLSDRLLGCSSARPASSVSGVNRGQVFKEGSFKGGDHAKNEDSKRQESREHRTTPFWGISPKTTLLLSLTSIDSRLSLRPHPFRIAHRCPTLLLHVVCLRCLLGPFPCRDARQHMPSLCLFLPADTSSKGCLFVGVRANIQDTSL